MLFIGYTTPCLQEHHITLRVVLQRGFVVENTNSHQLPPTQFCRRIGVNWCFRHRAALTVPKCRCPCSRWRVTPARTDETLLTLLPRCVTEPRAAGIPWPRGSARALHQVFSPNRARSQKSTPAGCEPEGDSDAGTHLPETGYFRS